MSNDMIRNLLAGILLVHGLGHGGALAALAWIKMRPGDDTGAWLAARSWLVPSLPAATATALAGGFWIVSLIGFVAAALSFWGVFVPPDLWRPLALAASLVSLVGITLFFGTWPPFNTAAALAVNAAVIVTQLWLRWPTPAMLGR